MKAQVRLILSLLTILLVSCSSSSTPTSIINAAETGDIVKVKELLEKGENINATSDDGSTSLIYASQEGHIQVVKTLLDRGADVNLSNNAGGSPLLLASYLGHKNVVEMLINKGAKIDITDKQGDTALHYASFAGNNDIVEMLIEHGADIKHKSERSKNFFKGEVVRIDSPDFITIIKHKIDRLINYVKGEDAGSHIPYFITVKVMDGSVFGAGNIVPLLVTDKTTFLGGVSILKDLKIKDTVNVEYSAKMGLSHIGASATASATFTHIAKMIVVISG